MAFAQLVMSAGLVVSIVVAATAVSIGIARADALSAIADNRHGSMTVAMLIGVLFVGLSGIVAIMTKGRTHTAQNGQITMVLDPVNPRP